MPGSEPFLQVQSAYESLMTRLELQEPAPSAEESDAQQDQCNGARQPRKRGWYVRRQKTVGETLCDSLRGNPSAALRVWERIASANLEVTPVMLEELFKACGASGGAGLDGAVHILRDGTSHGLLSPEKREIALITMVKWCKEDSNSFLRIQAEMRESERTPEARKVLMQANRLYPGFSEATRYVAFSLESYSM